jgi:hypothetical protein
MRAEESSCNELVEKTANALNSDTLKLLFVSVQQNNINLCIWYAVHMWVHISLVVQANYSIQQGVE